MLLGLPSLSSCTTWSFGLSYIAAVLAILSTDLGHSIVAQMSGVAMILIVYIVIATFLVFSRDTSLNPFIHRSTLKSLFGRRVDSHGITILLYHHIIPPNWVVRLTVVRLIWSSCFEVLVMSTSGTRLWSLLLLSNTVGLTVFLDLVFWHKSRNTVGLTVFLDLCQNTKSSLRWNQTRYNLLSNIFGRCSKKIFKLDGAKLLDNRTLFAYTLVESLFKLI